MNVDQLGSDNVMADHVGDFKACFRSAADAAVEGKNQVRALAPNSRTHKACDYYLDLKNVWIPNIRQLMESD